MVGRNVSTSVLEKNPPWTSQTTQFAAATGDDHLDVSKVAILLSMDLAC